jgi:hypothetical protein
VGVITLQSRVNILAGTFELSWERECGGLLSICQVPFIVVLLVRLVYLVLNGIGGKGQDYSGLFTSI